MNRNRLRIFQKITSLMLIFGLLAAPGTGFCHAEETAAPVSRVSVSDANPASDSAWAGKPKSKPGGNDGHKIHIVLDPGHGGSQPGAERGSVMEKDINLKIAHYLKEELEDYEGVTVTLTRNGDETVELEERTEIALDENADVLISLHNNSTGPCCPYDNGSTVLVAKGNYVADDEVGEQLALEEQKLGCNILNELESAGLTNQGLLLRDSEADEHYEDGTLADYYAIIRNGVLSNLPSILIEHAFLDDDDDYETYLSNDDGLRTLARADARGIARYYQLTSKETGETLLELDDYQAKLVHVRDGRAENNDITYRTYYEETTAGASGGATDGADSGDVEAGSGEATAGAKHNGTEAENSAVGPGHTAVGTDNSAADGPSEDGRVNDGAFAGESQTAAREEDAMSEKDRDAGRSTFVIALVVTVLIFLGAAGGVLWVVCRKKR